MSRTILFCCILICNAELALAEDAEVSDEQIDRLIRELVSSNESPHPSKAYHALRKLGPKAFHQLFNHFDDNRYSMTGDGGERKVEKTVGQVCIHLVDSQLEPYSPLGGPAARFYQRRPKAPNYFSHFKLRDSKAAHEWWETHKDKSLKELQIEVLEWVISEEERLTEKYSDKDRDKVRKRLEELRMQENPIPPPYLFAQ